MGLFSFSLLFPAGLTSSHMHKSQKLVQTRCSQLDLSSHVLADNVKIHFFCFFFFNGQIAHKP